MHAGKQTFFSIRSHVMSKSFSIVLINNHIKIQPYWASVSPSYSSTIKLKKSAFANQHSSVICFEVNSFIHYRSNQLESCYVFHLQLKYFLAFNKMISSLKNFFQPKDLKNTWLAWWRWCLNIVRNKKILDREATFKVRVSSSYFSFFR